MTVSKGGPLGVAQALLDEFLALQMGLSGGFMFHVGLSEGKGNSAFLENSSCLGSPVFECYPSYP